MSHTRRKKNQVKENPTCSNCQVPLVVGENWTPGLQRSKKYMCRSCQRAYIAELMKDPVRRQRSRDCHKKYRANWTPEKIERKKQALRAFQLKRDYGITEAEYEALLAKQDGKCAICFTSSPGKKSRFNVDHNHTTGQVRGLLCDRCNFAIGLALEDMTIMARMQGYIMHHERIESFQLDMKMT